MMDTLLALALTASALLVPAAAPPDGGVFVDVRTVNGTGCPADTVSVAVLPDTSGFQLGYADFRAAGGGDAAPAENRRNCQVSLEVRIPSDVTYAIVRTDYSGSAHLEPGATAALRSTSYFAGVAAHSVTQTFAGPLDGDWTLTDAIDVAAEVYQPCGAAATFNVSTDLRVTAGTVSDQTSWIGMDASGSQILTTFRFEWKACTP